ncbi:MAG: O-antigen translocase [Spirochaetes bacterium]|nr:O-antigen translocase [Spirochaetota bacterium]
MNKSFSDSDSKSYKQIIKSTTIMGGSQVVTIILRIIRTKALALLLGPAGVGIIGIYDSITSLGSTIAGVGLEISGVRQIAEASSTGDEEKISRTIISLRRTALLSGIIGAVLLLILSNSVSRITFGNSEHARDIAILSITVLFTAVTGGQTALIQGMRRIRDLAMLSILGAFWGTVFSIPIIYFFGPRGIVFFMIMVSAMSIVSSWWYSRKIPVRKMRMSLKETVAEAKPLLRLGIVFMTTSLIGFGSLYIIRVLVVRNLGLEAAGMYQAATTLSALYVGFILDAMGRDFYPRLTALAGDSDAFKSLVNKQIETGLLIAIPGVLATMSLAQIVIYVFYSSKFMPAYDVLRWQLLGDVLRIMTWPMGFILLAKGNSRFYFWTELFGRVFHLGLIWLGIQFFGLTGTGMAFFGMYVLYGIMIYLVVKNRYQFTWSPMSVRIGILTVCVTAVVFITPYFLSDMISLIVNLCVTAGATVYSFRMLRSIIGPQAISDFMNKIKTRLGIKGK